MIKTFEQFISEKYGNPVNEAFQSSKLREIIKQHGKPIEKHDMFMLYDIKDDDIIEVTDDKDYFKKHPKSFDSIKLSDGYRIILKSGCKSTYNGSHKHYERAWEKIRRSDVEKDVHAKHLDNVEKLEIKRFAKKLQPYIPEIIENITSILSDKYSGFISDIFASIEDGSYDLTVINPIDFKMNLGGIEYDAKLWIDYTYDTTTNCKHRRWSNFERAHICSGTVECNVKYSWEYFEIHNGELYVDSVDLADVGMTKESYPDFFNKTYEETDEFHSEWIDDEPYDYGDDADHRWDRSRD